MAHSATKPARKPAKSKTARRQHGTPAKISAKKPKNAWRILLISLRLLVKQWRFYLIFCLVMALLNILLVHNFSADIASLQHQISQSVGSNKLVTSLGTYALLVGSNSASGSATGVYQYVLLILGSLAAIWSLRQFMSDDPPARLRVRDSFYEGMYPLVQFVLVLIVLAVELVPFALAASLYSLIVTNGIAVTVVEQVLWFLVFLAGAVLSLWLFTRSIFALYIATLPGMRPIEALREAGRAAKGYKFAVVRKLLFLLLFLLLVNVLLVVPVIALFPPLAQFVLFAIGMISLPLFHAYFYTFYREVIDA